MLLKAPRQWIASPVGFNVLLSKLKENVPSVEKYKQFTKFLENTQGFTVKSKLFISKSYKSKENLNSLINITDIEETDFSTNDNGFAGWVSKYGKLKDNEFHNEISSDTEFVLTNICLFENDWESYKTPGPDMGIFNSYNYSIDVKYEARVLKLPLHSGFKLVIQVPNETDVLHTLFDTLTSQGLTAAINSIHPLFVMNSELQAPHFEVSSRIQVMDKISALPNTSTFQYGSIAVTDKGIVATVVTSIYSPATTFSAKEESPEEAPFYFAVIYRDTPMFTGQFTKQ